MENREVVQEQGGELGKQQKRFDLGLAKLNALMKGNLKPVKRVDNSAIDDIVAELLKEEQELLKTTLKDKLKGLLTNKIKLEKEVAIKQKELDDLKADKLKEFNKEMDSVFNMVENVNKLEQDYNNTLKSVETDINQ